MASPTTDKSASDAQVSPEAFMGLLIDMSRLLTYVGRMEPFKGAKLGLAEWAALSAIRDTANANNKELSRLLGVTGQRVNQISDALKRDGLINVKQSAEDSRMIAISLTDAGRQRLAEFNAKLTPMLAEGLKGTERAVQRTPKIIRRIMRAFRAPASAGTPGRPNKSRAA